jgi:hypothetical protein
LSDGFLGVYFIIKTIICMSQKTTQKNVRKTSYRPVTNNIYYDGTSYRVRVSRDGEKHSRNFETKKAAITYRNSLLETR